MNHLRRICAAGLLLLGASPFDAVSSGTPGVPEAGIATVTQAASPPPMPSRDGAAARKPASAGGNPLWGIPLARLSETRDRPIFSLSRRPPPPVEAPDAAMAETAAAAQKPPERPSLALLGTIVNGQDGFGIFMDQATTAPLRIRIGADYHGWTLRQVRSRSAMLQKGDESVQLELPVPSNRSVATIGQPIAGPVASPPVLPPRQGATTAPASPPFLSPESASLRMPPRSARSASRRH